MEHILQFGINIDDDTIKKRVMESAEGVIINQIADDIKGLMFEHNPYRTWEPTKKPTQYLDHKIDEFIVENKESIIELAAERLAERLSKTKRVKEMVDEVINDNLKGE